MPGRIDMDQQGAVGSLDLKKDRSHAQIAPSAPAVQGQPGQQANGLGESHGPNGTLANGSAADAPPPTTNGEVKSSTIATSQHGHPPPLDESWREQPNNKSFGKLLSRVSQQCFVDLQDTLSNMSAIQEEAQRPQVNGATPAVLDTSEASLKKKRMLMDFASSQRDRFIKTLVLADASKNEEDHGQLITIKAWQQKQRVAYKMTMDAIGITKVKTIDFKQARPNLEAAMEVLSTGKLMNMPHLGYIPPKKATAKELLATLRDMNVMIATRLSLNDELSPHMQEYTIANGRVTFRVPGEFEVDLSVGDDDPESQFFFLDLRLSFAPSAGAISDTLRSHLESRVNSALMEKGLPGCYDFLHNFVLTHKINVLRSQVSELNSSKWFDCIRAENLRRSLTVQYWIGRPGPKSWLEFGISTGKVKHARSKKTPAPSLSVRWFRRGVEVKDEHLHFDWSNLDLEQCLSEVIERHTSWVFNDLQPRIASLAPTGSSIEVRVEEEAVGPRALVCGLSSARSPLRLRIDAVTGLYSISPPSGPSARAERHLNNDPAPDAAQLVANTLCSAMQEKVHRIAELLQWAAVPRLVRQDDLQKLFGSGIRAHSTFVPRQAWGEHWALAVTFSLTGEDWWAVSLTEKRDDQGQVVGRVIASAQRLRSVPESGESYETSRTKLLHIERSAVAEVALGALASQLRGLRVSHRFEKLSRASCEQAKKPLEASESHQLALFFAPSTLLKHSRKKPNQTWTNDLARLTHHGIVESGPDGPGVRHDLRLVLKGSKMKQLQKHLTNLKDRNLVLHDDGAVALKILAPFGKPFADQLRSRLQCIERLDRHVQALQKHGLACTQLSLSRISFTYQKNPELSATLTFPHEEGKPSTLKVQPCDINPHSRVKVLMETGLNETGDKGVEAVGFILLFTLPLLRAFERMESSQKVKQAVLVQPRTATQYALRYKAPLPVCSFEIRARTRKEGTKRVAYWLVQLRKDGPAVPQALAQALSQELWQAKDEHWEGKGNGLVARAMGIGSALDKLDAVVRRFESATGEATKVEETSAKDENQSQAANGQQQQQQQPAAPVKKEKPDVIMLD